MNHLLLYIYMEQNNPSSPVSPSNSADDLNISGISRDSLPDSGRKATARQSHSISVAEFDRRVAAAWREAGCPAVLACVSGGADSVAMLRSLRRAMRNEGKLMALHCNFHLRGEESDRDQIFVERLCESLDIQLNVKHFDVDEYRRQNPCSLETACRDLRYRWFREEMIHLPSPARIATGHNADDNIETLLLNLFRGAGIRGLKGMLPDTGEILRPLLSMSRQDIIFYIENQSENIVDSPLPSLYITDSSNLSSDFRRNFIRNELLPMIEGRWPGVRKAISRSIGALREQSAILDSLSQENGISAYDAVSGGDLGSIPLTKVRDSVSPVTSILNFISPFGGNSDQAREIAAAIERKPFQSGKIWKFPHDIVLSLEREWLQLLPADSTTVAATTFIWGIVKLTAEERRRMKNDRTQWRAWLPLSPEHYEIRKAKRADRMQPLGMRGSRLLSDIMKDAHMSREQKLRQMVVTDKLTGEIIWAPGLRRSRLHLISDDAEQCYIVEAADYR